MDKGKIYSLCIVVLLGMACSAYGMEATRSEVVVKQVGKLAREPACDTFGMLGVSLSALMIEFGQQASPYDPDAQLVQWIEESLESGESFTPNKDAQGHVKRGQRLLLFYAVHHNELQLAKKLFETGISGDVIQGKNQLSLLHVAGTSSVEMVKLLLKHGARVNARDAGEAEAPSCKPLDSVYLDYCFSEKPKEVARIMKLLRKKRATCNERCRDEVETVIQDHFSKYKKLPMLRQESSKSLFSDCFVLGNTSTSSKN